MKNKPFEMCMLFDFYGDILTEKQQELFDLYYNEDLSLAEISEHAAITRQAVRDSIVRSEHILRNIEEKLGLAAKYGKIQDQLNNIVTLIREVEHINQTNYKNGALSQRAKEIYEIAERLSENS